MTIVQAPPGTVPPIPSADEVWPHLAPLAVDAFAGDVIVALDLSPAISVQGSMGVVGQGGPWSGSIAPPVTANQDVWFVDLGALSDGRSVILIRAEYSIPPDPDGLVEDWLAIGVERAP